MSETILEGSSEFHTAEGDGWQSSPYDPPSGALYQYAGLVCDTDGPVAVWPNEMIDGLTMERHVVPELEGTFLTQPLAGPGTEVLRSARQGDRQISQLGTVGSNSIEFAEVADMAVAAAVNDEGDAVVASLSGDHYADLTWHYLPSVLPTE